MAAAPRRVVLVAYDGVQLLDVIGPADVLGGVHGAYDLCVATPDGGSVRAPHGLRLEADAALADVTGPVDTLIVAGGWGSETVLAAGDVVDDIGRIAAQSRRVCSVCSGSFLLAAAGVLAGRTATTHWAVCGELARRHPDVTVEADRIFVRDGNVVTSAGVTAGMDLALALVEEDHGADVARTIARWLVMFVQRPGGQSQFSERIAMSVGPQSPLRGLLDAIVADPAGAHDVPRLASRASMSERHLTRVFSAETGTTPARFVERVRVEAARDLLERSRLPVAEVAQRCGFGDDEGQRRSFLRVLGVGPAEYRRRFQTVSESPHRLEEAS